MYELVPNTSIPRVEGSIIELSRAIDHLIECASDLGEADITRLRAEHKRIIDVILWASGKAP